MTAAPAAWPRAAATPLDALADLVTEGDVVVLSGAGLSTDSGIPDYRGATGSLRRHTPMTYQTFTRDPRGRHRYWARSFVGWRQIRAARPNAGHRAVGDLQVPRDRVDRCFELVDDAGSLLVLGSSLTVMSGYRFVLRAAKLGIPVAIVNVGPTRGDAKADVRLDAPLGQVLPELAARLVG